MKEFEINLEEIGPAMTMVHVAGWLDAHTFEFMEQTIQQLFKEGKVRLAVNLSDVEYMSSAGAGVFIGTLSESQARGGNIVLMNPTEPVQEVFDMLGLSRIFKFADTPQQAIELLSAKK
jgi:anti-sigma B factor antagonist